MDSINLNGAKFKYQIIFNDDNTNCLPYILCIPDRLEENKELVVESLNFEGTNIIEKIVPKASEQLQRLMLLFNDAPILIPFVPDVRGGIPYYQQLSRECFEKSNIGSYTIEFPRIDLQVINTIYQAKKDIKQHTQKNVADKIFLNGYSSSGVFAQRFALIHPEVVGRLLIGGASGSIPLPSSTFDYPLGIKDFKQLFGIDFNNNEYKKIQFAYYVGELEARNLSFEHPISIKQMDRTNHIVYPPMHDMSYNPRSIDVNRGKHQRQLLGENLSERHKKCLEYYEKNGYHITSKIYRNANHREMFTRNNPFFDILLRDIRAFYKNNNNFQHDIATVDKIDMIFFKNGDEIADR